MLAYSQTVKTVSGLAGANLFAAVLGMLGAFLQARYVSPEELGYFRGFSIVTGYIFFLHLGFFTLLERLYPLYVGKNQKDQSLAVAEICRSWNIVITLFASGGFFILSILSLINGNWQAMLGWMVQAVIIANYFYGGYLSSIYNSEHKFSVLAKSTTYSSLINSSLIPLYFIWPYITMALRSSIGSLFNLIFIHHHCPVKLRWRFNVKELVGLSKEGLPLFIASYGSGIGWETLEKSLVLIFIGTTDLGYWSFSYMLIMMMQIIPQSIVAIYLPRVTEAFGRTGNVIECVRLFYKPILWGLPLMLAMVGVIIFTLPTIVPIITPQYVFAVSTMSLMMLSLPLSLLNMPHTLLIAIGNLIHLNIITFISLVSFLLLAFMALKLDFGLNGIVIASLLGKVIRIGLIYYFINLHRLKSCEDN